MSVHRQYDATCPRRRARVLELLETEPRRWTRVELAAALDEPLIGVAASVRELAEQGLVAGEGDAVWAVTTGEAGT